LLETARTPAVTIIATPQEQTQNQSPCNAAPELFKDLQPAKKKAPMKFPMGLSVAVLVAGGFFWMRESHPVNRVTFAASVQRTEQAGKSGFQAAPLQENVEENGRENQDSDHMPAAVSSDGPVDPKPEPAAVAPPAAPAATATVPPKPVNPPEPTRSVRTQEMGTLAVSSPVAADIYQNGRFVGSTPGTLQLNAGLQTLEYRHEELRRIVTHEIKPNETTAVSITFDVAVQLNAKPWAQVFLDGSTRRPLGQTPLSGVSVPIGGTLIFENPNFPPKTHRITEKETTIQLNFP
jgi:cytoskeletal protein RodZ